MIWFGEIALTGRGPGAVFPMMPAVLPRRSDAALQQHRKRTCTRSFPATARSLRIIIRPRGSHICLPLLDCGAERSRRGDSARLASPRSPRPLARGHATAVARRDVRRLGPRAHARQGRRATRSGPANWTAQQSSTDILIPRNAWIISSYRNIRF